jgi:hypothetical protein
VVLAKAFATAQDTGAGTGTTVVGGGDCGDGDAVKGSPPKKPKVYSSASPIGGGGLGRRSVYDALAGTASGVVVGCTGIVVSPS